MKKALAIILSAIIIAGNSSMELYASDVDDSVSEESQTILEEQNDLAESQPEDEEIIPFIEDEENIEETLPSDITDGIENSQNSEEIIFGEEDSTLLNNGGITINKIDGTSCGVADFGTELVALFYGRVNCSNTTAMIDYVVDAKKNNRISKSITIVLMDVDTSAADLQSYANAHPDVVVAHSDSYKNDAFQIAGADSITFPVLKIVNSSGNEVYKSVGYDINGLNKNLIDKEEDTNNGNYMSVIYDVQYGQTEARGILDKINSFRTNSSQAWYWNESDTDKVYNDGLQPLTYDYDLEEAAMIRAAEIAVFYSHTRPNGRKCSTAHKDMNNYGGENIAAGYKSADAVFAGWKEDSEKYSGQGHRRNMLRREAVAVGIGHVKCNGIDYWVQEFGFSVNNTSKTEANDREEAVETAVLKSYLSNVKVNTYPASLQLTVGDYELQPDYETYVVFNSTFPNTGVPVWIKDLPDGSWQIENTSIVRFEDGLIYAAGAGETNLIIKVGNYSARVPVTVKAKNTVNNNQSSYNNEDSSDDQYQPSGENDNTSSIINPNNNTKSNSSSNNKNNNSGTKTSTGSNSGKSSSSSATSATKKSSSKTSATKKSTGKKKSSIKKKTSSKKSSSKKSSAKKSSTKKKSSSKKGSKKKSSKKK